VIIGGKVRKYSFKTLLLWLAAVMAQDAFADYHYRVSVEPDLQKMSVNVCFGETIPEKLVAESMDASVALIGVWRESGEAIKTSGSIPTAGLPPGSCLDYEVDISRGIQRHDMTGPKVYKSVGATAVSNGLWFWRPELFADNQRVIVKFVLPQDFSVASPWTLTGDTNVLEVPETPYDWPSWIVLGQFFNKTVNIGDTRFDISIANGSPTPDSEALFQWIKNEASYAFTNLGPIPYPNIQIYIFPNARARQPVPVAYVTRGGGPTLHMMINQRRSITEFHDDWTATHELSHLFLPFISPDDAWLYEGFASYYQYVIRARAGAMSQAEAWSDMMYGFRRGSREAEARDLTLLEATQKMYQGEPFMQVYWAGAAMMLIADVQLRSDPNDTWSLDRVVREFNLCCMDRTRPWTAWEVLTSFDEIYGKPLFVPLMNKYASANEFPVLDRALESLGLVVNASDLEFSSSPEKRLLRDQIMSPPSD
jgi:hypothetical protein